MDIELQERIYILWDELADMNPADGEQSVNHLMETLCKLTDAQNASWFGSVRIGDAPLDDPAKGWRISVIRFLHPTKPLKVVTKKQAKQLSKGIVDESTVGNMAGAGTFRANHLPDVVSKGWFDSVYYQVNYQNVGYDDAIFIAFPVNEDAESWFSFLRATGEPFFTYKEKEILAYALRGIKWFHRQLMLKYGFLIAETPLTPAERRVLQHLLTGISEKEIGLQLGITTNSAHQYVVAIYRKFGVNSRAALMSIWLGTT